MAPGVGVAARLQGVVNVLRDEVLKCLRVHRRKRKRMEGGFHHGVRWIKKLFVAKRFELQLDSLNFYSIHFWLFGGP